MLHLYIILSFIIAATFATSFDFKTALNKSDPDFQEFSNLINKFNFKLLSSDDVEQRLTNFRKSKQQIASANDRYKSAKFSVNKFALMSAEERKKYLGANKPNPVSKKIHQNPHDAILSPLIPTSYDFRSVRKVSPVKNQGGCGSCWAFASVAAVESQYLIRQNKTLDLSEQTLVSCDRDQNGGGSSGWMNLAYNYIQTKGIPTETCNPYETADGICTKACNNQRYFIDSYICFGDDESKFAKDLYNFGPASMSFAVPEAMFFYESGILDIPADQCLNENIGWHAAVIVGYTPEYWIAKNSWGKDWGERGFFRFKRGQNFCCMTTQVITPYLKMSSRFENLSYLANSSAMNL